MAYNIPLSSINASDGNVTYAQGSVLRVGAGGNVNAVGSIVISAGGNLGIGITNPTEQLEVAGNGKMAQVSDSKGDLRTLVINSQGTGYTLQASDHGKLIDITTGGVTVPANTFSVGQNITIYNDSSSNQTITATAVTCYLAGTATTGNRTLSQRGICTLVCVADNTFVISGAGLS